MGNANLKKPFSAFKKETTSVEIKKKEAIEENTKMDEAAMSIFNTMGKNIKKIRKLKGLTLEQLAKEAKLSATYLQLIEKGIKNVSVRKIYGIAEALGVKAEDLFGNVDIYKTQKLFEVCNKLKKYSHKQLIDIEKTVNNFWDIQTKENQNSNTADKKEND